MELLNLQDSGKVNLMQNLNKIRINFLEMSQAMLEAFFDVFIEQGDSLLNKNLRTKDSIS